MNIVNLRNLCVCGKTQHQLSGEFEQTLSPKATNSLQLHVNVHVHLIYGAQ